MCPQGPSWLEERIARALAGTEYEEHGWHCWCRGGTALLKWMGVPIDIGQWWGRWGSRRVAADYTPPPPDFPDNLRTFNSHLEWRMQGNIRH